LKLTVVAAGGGIGRPALLQAVAAGHDVTAVVRDPAKVAPASSVRWPPTWPGPTRTRCAGRRPGADAVLPGPGAATRADFGVAEHGTAAMRVAMRATGVRRIVAISAAPIGTVPSPGRPNPPRPGGGRVRAAEHRAPDREGDPDRGPVRLTPARHLVNSLTNSAN
jgi:nucleoside-diphosphate-sugar epimerase